MTLDRELMQTIIKRYPRSRSAIMPLLHYVQSVSGYVTNEGIETISEILEIETAEVSAVELSTPNTSASQLASTT